MTKRYFFLSKCTYILDKITLLISLLGCCQCKKIDKAWNTYSDPKILVKWFFTRFLDGMAPGPMTMKVEFFWISGFQSKLIKNQNENENCRARPLKIFASAAAQLSNSLGSIGQRNWVNWVCDLKNFSRILEYSTASCSEIAKISTYTSWLILAKK